MSKCRICGEDHQPWVHISESWTVEEIQDMAEHLLYRQQRAGYKIEESKEVSNTNM